MKLKKLLKFVILVLFLCLAASVILFLYNANHRYSVNAGFISIPLSFDPDDSSSRYDLNGVAITVTGGFVKGIQKDGNGSSRLVIRALAPLPTVTLKATSHSASSASITLENINPDFYAKSIPKGLNPVRTAVNSLNFTFGLNADETKEISPAQPDSTQNNNYVILGDSRDGYETFGQIIDQVNGLKPVFVIDNGDLVFSGKPNQYRLFDQMASRFSSTLCTTLGNHDIRGNGRATYTELYGPKNYSFDYGNNHFAFLDSSPGWAQKQAISEDQYAWLGRDLAKAQGKRIFVITHIPPVDPRSGTTPNQIPAYTDKVKQGDNFFEQKLDAYSENENMDHGFQDKQEAARFESLMTKYRVDTVYLSHIHSYFDFTKNGVRYVISGGAGAELLTKNSYYHYLIAKTGSPNSLVMVQLPSPPNVLLQRYVTMVSLFAQAMYKENTVSVILFLVGVGLLVLLLLLLLWLRLNRRLSLLWILTKDTGRFIRKRSQELFIGSRNVTKT